MIVIKKRILSLFIVLILIFSSFGLSVYATDDLYDQEDILYQKFEAIMDLIENYGLYYGGEDLLRDYLAKEFAENPYLFEYMADGLLKMQDKNSGYFDEADYASSYTLQKSFTGIGVAIQATANGFVITNILEGSPASETKLAVGDIITHVGGTDLSTVSLDGLSSLLMGESGTDVWVTVKRSNGSYIYKVTRGEIALSNVSYTEIEPGLAYIRLDAFGGLNDYLDFFEYFSALPSKETKSLILDLRNNLGGNLDMALEMLQDMIPDAGIEMAGFQKKPVLGGFEYEVSKGLGYPLNKIVILVNENSASASELVAGVMRDLGYADLVGTQTYGKATGQYHFNFFDGSTAVLTALGIVLPSGESYNEVGLTPTYYVENEIAAYPMPEFEALDTSAPVYVGETSSNAKAANERLCELGFLALDDEAMSYFSVDSKLALNAFQVMYGYARTTHASTQALAQLQAKIDEMAASDILLDHQLDKAIELAQEGLLLDLPYTFDQFGYPVKK